VAQKEKGGKSMITGLWGEKKKKLLKKGEKKRNYGSGKLRSACKRKEHLVTRGNASLAQPNNVFV